MAGYVKHVDKSSSEDAAERLFTFVYYFNEYVSGGQIRLHTSSVCHTSFNSGDNCHLKRSIRDMSNQEHDQLSISVNDLHVDVSPVYGRLVIFKRLEVISFN
jgi:hypothetical protein